MMVKINFLHKGQKPVNRVQMQQEKLPPWVLSVSSLHHSGVTVNPKIQKKKDFQN